MLSFVFCQSESNLIALQTSHPHHLSPLLRGEVAADCRPRQSSRRVRGQATEINSAKDFYSAPQGEGKIKTAMGRL